MEEQKTNVVITRSPKSQGISFILTFLFGPLGLFYSTVLGGVIMLVLGIIITVVTLGVGAILVWIVCIIWGAIAVSSYNGKLLGNRSVVKPMVAREEAYRDSPAKVKEEEVEVTEKEREEYAAALSLKSDEELKTLIQDEKMYDPVFIALVREELMERVIGKRRQRTAEELCREQEEKQQQAELKRLEEERLRLQQEEEQRRQEEIRLREEAEKEKQQQKIQRIQSLSLGKMQDGWMLALGLGIFFGGMCIYNLMDILGWIFYIQVKANEWPYSYIPKMADIYYLVLVGFIFYGIGMKKMILSPHNQERAGVKLVFYSMLIFWSVNVLLALSPFLGFALWLVSPYSYMCANFVYFIAWMLCVVGFIRISKKSCTGLIGKRGATYLSTAAWVYAGMMFLWLLFNLWYYILSDLTYQIMLYFNVAIRMIGMIACIICLILMWKGWKYLLSSWAEENSNV